MITSPLVTTDTHVFFYGGHHFSNWWMTPRQFHDPVLDHTWSHSEGCFMAWKAHLLGDNVSLRAIAAVSDQHPAEAKRLGRAVKGYNEDLWGLMRESAMTWVLLCKYGANPEWAAELKATEGRILVEASPVDKTWGVGLDIDHAASFVMTTLDRDGVWDESMWPGQNLLGRALGTVRGLL